MLLPAMGMFYVADILGGSRNLLVGNIIKNQFLDARDWPFGAAASVLLTLAMAVLFSPTVPVVAALARPTLMRWPNV